MSKQSTEEYRNNITLHLARMSGDIAKISGDIEHIKEKVNDNNNQLRVQNGRIRKNEASISWIKGVGTTITFIIGSILTWLNIEN